MLLVDYRSRLAGKMVVTINLIIPYLPCLGFRLKFDILTRPEVRGFWNQTAIAFKESLTSPS